MLGGIIWIAADDVRKHNSSQVARNKMLLVVRDPWQRLLKLLQNYLQTRFLSEITTIAVDYNQSPQKIAIVVRTSLKE